MGASINGLRAPENNKGLNEKTKLRRRAKCHDLLPWEPLSRHISLSAFSELSQEHSAAPIG